MIREWERLHKAKRGSFKLKNDPDYMEKVRKYHTERKKNLHHGMEFTSRKGKEKANPSPMKKVTSRFDQSSTPVKKPPSYYKVLATSKKVQDLLRPSPKTHTTILKHLLNKAIRSPRKSQCMGEYHLRIM